MRNGKGQLNGRGTTLVVTAARTAFMVVALRAIIHSTTVCVGRFVHRAGVRIDNIGK